MQRRELQVKAEIGEESTPMQMDTSSPVSYGTTPIASEPKTESLFEMQKRIMDELNKKPLTEMIAKKSMETKSAITKESREELKASLLKNDTIKAAMAKLVSK